MGYRSDVAIQFENKEVADNFIKEYDVCGKAKSSDFSSLFKYVDDVVTNEFGEVTYCWEWLKFYEDEPEVSAMIETLETDKFNAIFIRLGEAYDDVEFEEYGHTSKFQAPIYIQQKIVVGKED